MEFESNSNVLLIGEGNFSFAVSLCINKEYCSPTQLIATCFEDGDSLSQMARDNVALLRQKGVTVMFSIDGRRLETYFQTQFSHIIFNFPHIKGKMKIHLNRQLLQNFFESASNVVSPDGIVFVTLCSGQGGIPLDVTSREWNDTWQIVPMAAYGDMILSSITHFNPLLFPGYTCSGYRSLDKGFNLTDSLIYKFLKSKFSLDAAIKPLDNITVSLDDGYDVNLPLYSYKLLEVQENLFHKKDSFFHVMYSYICSILKMTFILNLQKIKKFSSKSSPIVFSQFDTSEAELTVVPCFIFDRNDYHFTSSCMIICTYKALNALNSFLNKSHYVKVHNTCLSWNCSWKTFTFNNFCSYKNIEDCSDTVLISQGLLVVDLERLSYTLFGCKKHDILSEKQHLSIENEVIVYIPYSLYPPVYTYHLSFWLPSFKNTKGDNFHNSVRCIVINVAQDSLVEFKFIGSFTSTTQRHSETYEIIYSSCNAFSKDHSLSLHHKVGKALESNLGCVIR